MSRERYSHLAPLPIEERVRLTTQALNFFSPLQNAEVCAILNKQPKPNYVEPLTGYDFVKYLKKSGKFPDAERHQQRIGELLTQLANAHLLENRGPGKSAILGTYYLFMRELTSMEKQNVLWLAPALGAEFILYGFRHAIVHITGVNASGDVHAGTGLMIDPFWVLTCAHVINEMTVDENQDFSGQAITVKRSVTHPTIDVGLLEISPGFASLHGMAFRNPRIAETIFILGFPRIPLSREPSLIMHRGEITNTEITTFSERKLFLYSAIARPGNSGGPVISSSGNVVGLVTEELLGQGSANDSFYAGVGGEEVARAISEIDVPVRLPIEDYT